MANLDETLNLRGEIRNLGGKSGIIKLRSMKIALLSKKPPCHNFFPSSGLQTKPFEQTREGKIYLPFWPFSALGVDIRNHSSGGDKLSRLFPPRSLMNLKKPDEEPGYGGVGCFFKPWR